MCELDGIARSDTGMQGEGAGCFDQHEVPRKDEEAHGARVEACRVRAVSEAHHGSRDRGGRTMMWAMSTMVGMWRAQDKPRERGRSSGKKR